MLTYTVELQPQLEGGYTVTIPSLPGCISEGETLDEALDNIKQAAEGYILSLAKHKKQIPLEFSDFRQVDIFKQPVKANVKTNLAYA